MNMNTSMSTISSSPSLSRKETPLTKCDRESVIQIYFNRLDETKCQCLCGKVIIQKAKSGWSNCVNHITLLHGGT